MTSVELDPSNSNILIQQDPLLSNSVTIVLDDVFIDISMLVSSPQEVIKGIASTRLAPSSSLQVAVSNVDDVITTNNLELEGEVVLPSLVLSRNLYSLPSTDFNVVSSQASQTTLIRGLNRSFTKSLLNTSINRYNR